MGERGDDCTIFENFKHKTQKTLEPRKVRELRNCTVRLIKMDIREAGQRVAFEQHCIEKDKAGCPDVNIEAIF